ncbi:MAG: hypothetical protein K6G56_02125 [Clostridiales bacterium]|nr:hypothetical protein [Clostridiales bacterium]
MDRTSVIFGNPIDKKTIKKAEKSKANFIKKFGDDTDKVYHLGLSPIEQIKGLGIQNLVHAETPLELPEKPLVVGNIRMGFGHYRIALAIASCARELGFTPLWFDLASFDATGSKMIRHQNDLYSMGSKLSQKIGLFNKLVWEPLNSEGFRKITYNAADQKNAELLVPLFADLPKDIPYVGTHVWPSQGAVHAGLTHVVNAIPDNWPMGLHLAEGSIHTVQTSFAYLGYKKLNGMAKHPLKPMPDGSLYRVGHYIDHELVSNVEKDCGMRLARIRENAPVRFLMTVGGAGAGGDLYLAMAKHLLPYVKAGKASLMINFGDHLAMWEVFKKQLPELTDQARTFFDDYAGLCEFAETLDDPKAGTGVTAFCHKDIFEAVYSTNLLMRKIDVLVTKPSELAFYPVPKLMMRHIGGHEVYGAIYSREMGDATYECETAPALCDMIDTLINDKAILAAMCSRIVELKAAKVYDGGYEVVKLAAKGMGD